MRSNIWIFLLATVWVVPVLCVADPQDEATAKEVNKAQDCRSFAEDPGAYTNQTITTRQSTSIHRDVGGRVTGSSTADFKETVTSSGANFGVFLLSPGGGLKVGGQCADTVAVDDFFSERRRGPKQEPDEQQP